MSLHATNQLGDTPRVAPLFHAQAVSRELASMCGGASSPGLRYDERRPPKTRTCEERSQPARIKVSRNRNELILYRSIGNQHRHTTRPRPSRSLVRVTVCVMPRGDHRGTKTWYEGEDYTLTDSARTR